jgi:uncharacterized protein (UPF0333 family)
MAASKVKKSFNEGEILESKNSSEKLKKGTIGVDYLAYLALAILVLLIGVGIYMVMKGKGDSLISYAKNLLRFKSG